MPRRRKKKTQAKADKALASKMPVVSAKLESSSQKGLPKKAVKKAPTPINDAALWDHVSRSVIPLADRDMLRRSLLSLDMSDSDAGVPTDDGSTPPYPAKPASGAVKANRQTSEQPPARHQPQPIAASLPTEVAIEPKMKRRLARGQLEPQARLDLHGYTQKEAHAALVRFVKTAHARGLRLVLVITGKGSMQKNDHYQRDSYDFMEHREAPGVLRRRLPEWVNQPPIRDFIIAIEGANLLHGGKGAFYLRIKRHKRPGT